MSAVQEHPPKAQPWAAWVCPAVLVLGLLDLAAGLQGHSWLDPQAERSPFSLASALAALAAAACVVVLATRGRRNLRLLLAASLAFVAADEAFGLHERVAADLDARALASLDWTSAALVGYTVLLGLVAVLLLLEIRASRRVRLPTMLLAGVLLLVAALAARFGGAALSAADALPTGGARHAGEAAMHAFDLMGWTLVAAGLLVLVRHPAR